MLTLDEKLTIQNELRGRVEIAPFGSTPKIVTGVDVAYHDDRYATAALVTMDYETKEVLECVTAKSLVTEPYEPSLLSFRELPAFLAAWKLRNIDPNIVFFDGNGLWHPRRMGLATHASFLIDKPTVGITKNQYRDLGAIVEPPNIKGAYTLIEHEDEILAACLRTRMGAKCQYVSVGNRITLEEAVEFTLHLTKPDSKYPIITKMADTLLRENLQR